MALCWYLCLWGGDRECCHWEAPPGEGGAGGCTARLDAGALWGVAVVVAVAVAVAFAVLVVAAAASNRHGDSQLGVPRTKVCPYRGQLRPPLSLPLSPLLHCRYRYRSSPLCPPSRPPGLPLVAPVWEEGGGTRSRAATAASEALEGDVRRGGAT